jgi:hypothetical protein
MIDAPDGTVEVENPAEVLRDEDGVFEVTSPYGHVFHVTCRPGSRMAVREISEPKRTKVPDRMVWRIRRLNPRGGLSRN